MEQKFIIGDIVKYDNKIMIIKEPRDGSHFDLSCPKEGLVYCYVGVDDMKSVNIIPAILEKIAGIKKKKTEVFFLYQKYLWEVIKMKKAIIPVFSFIIKIRLMVGL